MKRGLIFLALIFCISAHGQNKYWITFTDKSGVTFDPYSYFDPHTIANRIAHGIPVNDSSDYPVNPNYLDVLKSFCDSVSWSSRWLNGVAVYCSSEHISEIRQLNFVRSAADMNSAVRLASNIPEEEIVDTKKTEQLLAFQTKRMQGNLFVENKTDGKGIRIAVFDVGFPHVNDHPAFKHLRDRNQIIDTYDFVSREKNVYKGNSHGTSTLSCVGGMSDSTRIGLATGAEFFLARTERLLSECLSEEENWLAAAEWADKNGVNIISSSLGYTSKRYFNYQMDGHTSLVSRAATMAAAKGILVVNAAGNEGSSSWRYIDTPGDADSVLTVGGTDPDTDTKIYFSSFGPASDGNLKPNVCSLGEVIAAGSKGMKKMAGTSFSTPLVAGFAACAWQLHPESSNMELFDDLEKSAHLYPYFDYAHGFGIPQASWFLTNTHTEREPTFDLVIVNNIVKIVLREKYSYSGAEESLGYKVRRNFFYKIEDKEGKIKRYTVLLAESKELLTFYAEDFAAGDVLSLHFEGYTTSMDFSSDLNNQQ